VFYCIRASILDEYFTHVSFVVLVCDHTSWYKMRLGYRIELGLISSRQYLAVYWHLQN